MVTEASKSNEKVGEQLRPIQAKEINALPEKVRRYIHDPVSRCDKTGDVQTIRHPV
jgi:hypothetical protein